MSSVHDRLRNKGLTLPPVAAPVAAYVPAVRTGNLIMTSGQLPVVDGKLLATGKVGDAPDLVSPERAKELAEVCILNALAAAATQCDNIDDLIIRKLVGFVASDPTFTGQPGVINGASELLADIFVSNGEHARSAVGVASLPLDAPVEIELIAEVQCTQ